MDTNLGRVLDALPAMVWMALPDGHIDSVNRRWSEYTGLTLGEAQQQEWQSAINPDDLPEFLDRWQLILASDEAGEMEARMRRFDGQYRWFLFRANPLRDEKENIVKWYGTITDIDDWKRAKEELRQSEAFLADAQRLSRTGSFLWRVATEEVTWSDGTYRIYDLDPAVPVTLDLIRTRVHPDNLPMLREVLSRAQGKGGEFNFETRLLMPDQSVRYLRVFAHSDRNKDGEVELSGAVQDVTEARLAEEALSKARSELAHVARVTSLGVLTASIAHEVNQPLSGIITNASTCLRMLAADPPNINGARETARRTIRDGNRAADVIVRLRALFSKRTASAERVDLNETAREAITLLFGELQRGGVVLRTELVDDLPPISADRVQLQQVIINLLRNAVDAMSGIEGWSKQLVIRSAHDEDDHVRLSVEDTGVGFRAHDAERLFEAFYTTKRHGTGIGLSVSRSIIESHRGRLWAALNDGPGATFSFSIPAYTRDKACAHDFRAGQSSAAPNWVARGA